MNNEYKKLISLNEEHWSAMKSKIITDKNSPWYGAMEPSTSPGMQSALSTSVAAYCCKESKYYQDKEVLASIKLLVEFLLGMQRDNGLVSLINCNLNSPPDTAFTVHGITICYNLMVKSENDEAQEVIGLMRKWLKNTIPGLVKGGVHTPNHRWVVCGALALLYEIFKDEQLKKRIDQFLAQGLDISPDGEWTERSNAIYNAACDLLLYHVARVFDYDFVFEAISKNLKFMEHMLHPDGMVVTEFSRRQDVSMMVPLSAWYYCVCKLMASKESNGKFETMAQMAMDADISYDYGFTLLYYMLYIDDIKDDVKQTELSKQYMVFLGDMQDYKNDETITHYEFHKLYRNNVYNYKRQKYKFHNVVRHRNNNLSVTIMAAKSGFLALRYGDAKLLGMELAFGWFGMASMNFRSIRQIDDTHYDMHMCIRGVYIQPYDYELVKDAKGMLYDFPDEEPEYSDGVELDVIVGVALLEDGVNITIDTDKYDQIFTQAIFKFEQDGRLEGESIQEDGEHFSYLKDGYAKYTNNGYQICVSGGAYQHKFKTMRNGVINPDAETVAINLETPIKHEIQIRCKKIQNS
ncbi:MAG: hypothetical protein KAQ68_06890 [Clostridiales bacterium]|nr:hypothetical protein [Clostridiales bacterium]